MKDRDYRVKSLRGHFLLRIPRHEGPETLQWSFHSMSMSLTSPYFLGQTEGKHTVLFSRSPAPSPLNTDRIYL